MYNDLFSIGPLTIHGYGFMIALGVGLALLLATKRAEGKKLSAEVVSSLVLLCLFFGFLGAKLLYGIVEIKSVIRDPMLLLSGSGFVVYGGIIGGTLAAMVYCHIRKIPFLRYFDLLIPSVALAQGFGRVGCFLAGCCYGRETNSLIGIAFHHSTLASNGVKLIPTQIFSSVGCFILTAILILYARADRKPGKVGALYLILYSVGRFIIEFFRNDFRGDVGGLLSTSQFISLFVFALGMVLFLLKRYPWEKAEHLTTCNTTE